MIKKNKANILFVSNIILLILLCVFHSLSAGHTVDFYPLNGSFQNYNPVRRLLNGQVPYRDFQDYLGFGHLFLGAVTTFIYGVNFRASLYAFSFLALLGISLISIVIAYAIFNNKNVALSITNIFVTILLIQPFFLTNSISYSKEVLTAINQALSTGNSARFLRGCALPISVLLIVLGYNVFNGLLKKSSIISKYKKYISLIGIGAVAGFAFLWSNDYGISSWLCLIIMAFWVLFCRNRNVIGAVVSTIVITISSVLSIIAYAEIFTLGNIRGWFWSTFGTGGYQAWFYNSDKSYYIYDIDVSFVMLVQVGLVISYAILVFINRANKYSIIRYGVLSYVNMVAYCAVNEYRIMSGGYSTEVALAVLFLTVTYELLNLLINCFERRKFYNLITLIAIIISLSWIISTAKTEILYGVNNDSSDYVSELGGNTSLHNTLYNTDSFLNGAEFWSTFASAQEVVSGIYQPSGVDYIVHALGDASRTDYLNKFLNGSHKYTATIQERFSDWEYWLQRSNWYFYRELLTNWHPVYGNYYDLYWERNNTDDKSGIITNDYIILVENIDDGSSKIMVQCDSDNVNGYADVYLDYNISKKECLNSKLIFRMLLKISSTGETYSEDPDFSESYYLRSASKEYIPVAIVNGYGEITLKSYPAGNTRLSINDCSCDRILTTNYEYVEVRGVLPNAEGGYTVYIEKDLKNNKITNITRNASCFEYNDRKYTITNIADDGENICLSINEPFELAESNIIRLWRQ